ncbi:MAG: cation-translocating P-type ATPase [Anaerolineae bacterium]|nr:cation-translocating P-type ATPase [Anaerolineae bacterium]
MTFTHPHALSAEEVAVGLESDLKSGLSSAAAERRLQQYGHNELKEEPPPTLLEMFIEQFNNFVVILLIVAAVISGFVGAYTGEGFTDTIAILLIVALNAILGVVQEGRAEAALRALKKMSAPEARVIRDGQLTTIPSPKVVPGDIVILETGNYAPADVRLVESFNLTIDEASLTGESVPVDKDHDEILAQDAPIGDRHNMAYMSSMVTYGRGKGIVVSTGMNTEIGHIAEMIQSYEEEATPLQLRLDQLGKWLGMATLVICAIVFVVGIARLVSTHPIEGDVGAWLNQPYRAEGVIEEVIEEETGDAEVQVDAEAGTGGMTILDEIIELFMVAVSLAIAAVPEGLPAVVTIALALGMQRMISRHALIRKLASVETLGSANVICSDKTGTLTTNEMTVVKIWVNDATYDIEGKGYLPEGDFVDEGVKVNPGEDVRLLCQAAVMCNDAKLVRENGSWRMVGDPTEGALTTLGAKAGLWSDDLETGRRRVAEVPFDSARKRMTTIHKIDNNFNLDALVTPNLDGALHIAFTKGAPERVLELSTHIYRDGRVEPLSDAEKERIQEVNTNLAEQALRVLALAYRPVDEVPERPTPEEIEQNLVFIGLAGMIDPARPEVKPAIEEARGAGIRTIMITGDYPVTAAAIARELDLLKEGDRVLTGREMDELGVEGLSKAVKDVNVFARVSPENKVQIVEALKEHEYVVAMTGDGVNDAPALKRANIGVAMGITGTDVSKQTADMVLTDDNYASIVAAVEEGRVIYSNIRKFVYFLISCNVGEIAIIFVSMLAALPIPLLPIHLLWLNLVTDGAPALALGLEKGEPDIMRRKPRPAKEPIITGELWIMTAVQTVLEAFVTIGAFLIALSSFGVEWNAWTAEQITEAQTVAFFTLVTAELLRAYTARSERHNIWQIGVFTNKWMVYATVASFLLLLAVIFVPFLQPIFSTVPLNISELEYTFLLALLPSIGAEIAKYLLRKRDERAWQAEHAKA